ncbi:failed axon connections [Microplitis mediator]|uniref:failed axon connections n=1 Tax=Microplitis mediator TaxID=375433 RepID=UPI0025550CE6|nr:failed axon connections [Microplitis mediator]
MTVATEAENNTAVGEKENKEVKDMKAALNEETPPDNKQQQGDDEKPTEKIENEKKEDNAATDETAIKSVSVHKTNYDKDTVYLYQFSRTPVIPSMSPYCLKVETWLRLNDVKYENVDHKVKFRSKKGQLPFVELDGTEIPDSTIIIRELSQKFHKDLDANLTNEQRIISHAMISMIENHLVWVVTSWRAKNTDATLKGYRVNLQNALGSRLPNGILALLFKISYSRKCAKKVKAQGLGVHTNEEITQFGCDDLKALSELLADKPFFFGDEPTTLDVVAFAHLAQILYIEKSVPFALRDFMQDNCPNLVGHCSRMKERCFPDWDEICNTLDLNTHLPKPPKEETKESKEEKKESKDSKEGKESDEEKVEKEKEAEKDKEVENKEKEERVEEK